MIKSIIKKILKSFGKRIANYNAPAKPYKEGILFLSTIISKPDWIIDIGVADGTPELSDIFPFKEHNYLLVEADPRYSESLDKLKNQHKSTVHIEKCFCGESDESVNFYENKNGRLSSKYANRESTNVIKLDVKRLDSLFKKYKIEGSIFLKIDVEGAEIDVLKGATSSLAKCDVVLLESWINPLGGVSTPSDFATIVQFMKEHSFVVFDFFGGHSYKNGVLKMIDVVFVKEDSKYRKV